MFNDARINPGGHYDPTTGIYTVPQDGAYEFYVHILNGDEETSYWAFGLVVDESYVDYSRHTDDVDNPDYITVDLLDIIELVSGQQVSVSPTSMTEIYGSYGEMMYSWFSGRLVKAVWL